MVDERLKLIKKSFHTTFTVTAKHNYRRVGSNLKVGAANMASASEPEKIFWFAPPKNDDLGGVNSVIFSICKQQKTRKSSNQSIRCAENSGKIGKHIQ